MARVTGSGKRKRYRDNQEESDREREGERDPRWKEGEYVGKRDACGINETKCICSKDLL